MNPLRFLLLLCALAAPALCLPAPAAAAECSANGGGDVREAVACLDKRLRRLENDLERAVVGFEAVTCPKGWVEFRWEGSGRGAGGSGLTELPLVWCRRLETP